MGRNIAMSRGDGGGRMKIVVDPAAHPSTRRTPKRAASPAEVKPALHTTEALRQFARQLIQKRIASGCKTKGDRRGGTGVGRYACSLGCDYRSDSTQLLEEHEQRVYLPRLYFCPTCGDPENPSRKHIYVNSSSAGAHIRDCHERLMAASQIRITGIDHPVPQTCPFCPRKYFAGWNQRLKHIKEHYDNEDEFLSCEQRSSNDQYNEQLESGGEDVKVESDYDDEEIDGGDFDNELLELPDVNINELPHLNLRDTPQQYEVFDYSGITQGDSGNTGGPALGLATPELWHSAETEQNTLEILMPLHGDAPVSSLNARSKIRAHNKPRHRNLCHHHPNLLYRSAMDTMGIYHRLLCSRSRTTSPERVAVIRYLETIVGPLRLCHDRP